MVALSGNIPYATLGLVNHIPIHAGLHGHEYMHFYVFRCPVPQSIVIVIHSSSTLFWKLENV